MSIAFTQLLSGMLYGVSATDPATLVAGAVGVPGVSAAAALIPAVRAARLEPITVLRDERAGCGTRAEPEAHNRRLFAFPLAYA